MTRTRSLRWAAAAIFVVALVLWTWKLLEPSPIPPSFRDSLGSMQFFAAKGLHAGGYAFLTLLGLIWMPCRWSQWGIVGFLALHGIATEIGQTYVPNRFGTPQDVLIDWLGLLVGVGSYLLFERRRRPAPNHG